MSTPEERLGALTDAIVDLLTAGAPIDDAARAELAERFGVDPDDVDLCAEGAQAMAGVLAEPAVASPGTRRPTLPDDYELGEELGRGGMGVVYRAHQRSLDRDVALKILDPGHLIFGATLQRFEREARSLARLRHPHIVSIHEVGDAGGLVYFTMDLVDGQPLSALMRRRKPLPASRTVRLVRQVCSAMVYAHGQGLIHRDLKPANVLVSTDGDGAEQAFVVDFGLARDVTSIASYTTTGEMLGTPGYMSPEQALGQGDRIDERTDVYALGVILYECLTGRAPFAHLPLARMLHAVVDEAPEPIVSRQSSVPRDLAVIAHKAMAKEPGDRYATVQALDEDLARFERGEPIRARGPSMWRRISGGLRRHRQVATYTLGVVLVVAAITAQWVRSGARRDATLEQAERLMRSGQAEAALDLFAAAFGTDPTDELGLEGLGYAEALIEVGARAQFVEGNDHRAADLLEQARRVLGRVPEAYDLDAFARLCLAGFGVGDEPDLAAILELAANWNWGPLLSSRRLSVLPATLRFEELAPAVHQHHSMAQQVALDALEHFDRLPEAAREAFAARCVRRPWAPPPVPTADARFEEALAEYIDAESDDKHGSSDSPAMVAAAILDGVSAIPHLPRIEVDGAWRVVTDRGARTALVADWRRLRDLQGAARHHAAVASLARSIRDGLAASPSTEERALAPFVESFGLLTGRRFDPATDVESESSPADTGLPALRERLALDPALDLTDADGLFAASTTAGPTARKHLLALARLMVPRDVARPVGDDPRVWQQLQRTLPDLLHVAAFRFVDGSAQPVGVWSGTVSAASMRSVEWQVVSRAPTAPQDWGQPWLYVHRQVDAEGGQRIATSSWFWSGAGEHYSSVRNSEVRPGVPALASRLDGRRGALFVSDVFVALRPSAGNAVPRAWGEWQRFAAESADRIATGLSAAPGTAAHGRARLDLDAFGPAACALASPHARESLRALARMVREQEIDAPWLPWARLLAGDAGALEGAGPRPEALDGDADRAWLRIARSATDPVILEAAAAALRDADAELQQVLADLPRQGDRFAELFPPAWSPRRIGWRWIPLLVGAALMGAMLWRRRREPVWVMASAGILAFAVFGGVAAIGYEGRWERVLQLATYAVAAVAGLAAVHGRGPLLSVGILVWILAVLLGSDPDLFDTLLAAVYTAVALLLSGVARARATERQRRMRERRRRSAMAFDQPAKAR